MEPYRPVRAFSAAWPLIKGRTHRSECGFAVMRRAIPNVSPPAQASGYGESLLQKPIMTPLLQTAVEKACVPLMDLRSSIRKLLTLNAMLAGMAAVAQTQTPSTPAPAPAAAPTDA